VSVGMDVVGVMEAYFPVVRVYSALSRAVAYPGIVFGGRGFNKFS